MLYVEEKAPDYKVPWLLLVLVVPIADEYINEKQLFGLWKDTAMREIDVRIITPHIPDKKVVFVMTRSYYKRVRDAGVKIYEFEPGFIHAKVYLSDDKYAIVGIINLDYRSLVHHFENGIWMYHHEVLGQIKDDMEETMAQSLEVTDGLIKNTVPQRIIRAVVRAIAPLL